MSDYLIMKFDKIDKKLISHLYHNYREPLTEIAKACKISRDQVEYRLSKYENDGIIKKYLTIFNYESIGYTESVIVYLKLNGNNKNLIKAELQNMKEVITFGDVLCDYDLFFDAIYKSRHDFEEKFYSFVRKHNLDYSILQATQITLFPLKCFDILFEEKSYEVVKSHYGEKINEKDKQLLMALEQNGREKVVNLSKKTGISSELIIYKLKQFQKQKLILGTRIQFDMERMGFYFAVLRLKISIYKQSDFLRLNAFCKQHKHINAVSFGISESYNCLIQVFYENENELRKTIRDFKQEFADEYSQSQLLLIEHETKARTLPWD